MPTPAPPPLSLAPVRFQTPLSGLDSPVVLESEDGSVTVLELLARDEATTKVRLSRGDRVDPTYVQAAPLDLELGDFALTHLKSRPVRAYALPRGSTQTRHLLRVMALTALVGLVALGLVTLVLVSGLPDTAKAFLVVALVTAAVAGPIVRARLRPSVRLSYRTAQGVYPLDALLSARPAAVAAAASVDAVKEEYGALLSDICYRIEHPALFDPADAAAKRLTLALIRWDGRGDDLDASEIGALAGEVRVAFDTARANAETIGMRHLPEAAVPDAQRALKAARLATSTRSPAERSTALRQVAAILSDLALYYLPSPKEAAQMVEGRRILALPGRLSQEERR